MGNRRGKKARLNLNARRKKRNNFREYNRCKKNDLPFPTKSSAVEQIDETGNDLTMLENHSQQEILRCTFSDDELEIDSTSKVELLTPFKITGRRIIDIDFFFNSIKQFKHCELFNCSVQNLEIYNEQRFGLQSKFFMQCTVCKEKEVINSEKTTDSATMNINQSAVLGMISSGGGYSQLDEILSFCNIPSLNAHTFIKYENAVAPHIQQTALTVMEEAAKEESRLAVDAGEVDENGIPMISVVADGAWSKRSYKTNYNAPSGVGVIVGQRTGKILYLGVRNKYCCVCSKASNNNQNPPTHTCFKNWNKSSTAMESDIIVEGFRQSVSMHGLIYAYLIGDGDSSVTKKLHEARPYGTRLVHKIECKNHLLRNLSSKLKELSTKRISSIKKIVDFKQRNHLNNCLRRLRMAIQCAVKYYISLECTHQEKILQLKKDICNTPYHVFGQHDTCSSYFCKGPKPSEINWVPEMKNSGLFDDIVFIFNRLVRNAESLIINMDTNAAERYNSIVAKFVGGKRINFSSKGSYETRCQAASVTYNVEASEYPRRIIKTVTGQSPGKYTKQFMRKKKINRNWIKSRKALFTQPTKRHHDSAPPDEDYGIEINYEEDLAQEVFDRMCCDFLNTLKKTKEEIYLLQKETIGQSSKSSWQSERSKRLTASMFGRVCKMRQSTKCDNIVKQILYNTFQGNNDTKWGIDHELMAINKYEELCGKKIEACGLFVDEEYPFLGATPDGLLDEDGIVEIKCPASAKNFAPFDAIKQNKINFVEIINNKLKLKRNHNYYYQIQGQLHITKRKYCVFIVWTLGGLEFEIIDADENFWKEKMINSLCIFYHKCILPEIIDPRFPRNKKIRDLRTFSVDN